MGQDTTVQQVSIIDRIWNFFSSITLAIVVFTVISLSSIVGTVIEQQADPQRNLKLLAKLFGESSAPSIFRVVDALGFTDMYHSWWFISLLFLFAMNLIVCSLERLPKIWKLVKDPVQPITEERLKGLRLRREAVIKGKADQAREKVEAALKKGGYKPALHQEGGTLQLYAERFRYSRLGVYVTHLSVLLILIGAVVGIFFGFNARLNLLEGMISAVAYEGPGKEVPLGFMVRCDDFDVSFYEGSDTPKTYMSILTIIENGREVMKQEIEVNTPLTYRGITFYQSSYGFNPNRDSLFRFSVTSKGGKREDVQLKFGESFTIPGTEVAGKVADFTPALGIDEAGRPFTYAEMMNNPAVFVEFSEQGKPKYSQWILRRYPQTWTVQDGTVEFRDLWGAQYTGLQVRKDPGVWLVYLGCLLMSVGLYACFFMRHERVWVMLREEKGGTKVNLAGSVTKNRISFEQKIDSIMKDAAGQK